MLPQRRRVASNCAILPAGPIQCADCPQSFNRTTHLYRHQRAKHGGTSTFPCPQCPRVFLHADILTRHCSKSHDKSPRRNSSTTPRRRRRRTTKAFANIRPPFVDGTAWMLLPRPKFDDEQFDALSASYREVSKLIKIAQRTATASDGRSSTDADECIECIEQAALQLMEYDADVASRQIAELLNLARQCADIGSMPACAQLLLDAQAAIGNAFVAGQQQNDHVRTVTTSEAQELQRSQQHDCRSVADDSSSSVDVPIVYRVVSDTAALRYECDECGKRFGHRSVLNRHRDVHSGERRYACELCSMRFLQRSHVIRHRLAVHEARSDPARRPFECERCGRRFAFVKDLDAHVRIRHEGCDWRNDWPPGWCDECEHIFVNIAQHQSTAHRTDETTKLTADSVPPPTRKYQCDECGKYMATTQALRRHCQVVHGDQAKRSQCSACGKRFARIEGLRYHVKTCHPSSQ